MTPCILLADDHQMIRKGITASLETNFGYSNITEVNSCAGIMLELRNKAYTHLLLDVNLSDGSSVEILGQIRMLYPHVKIAIFTMLPTVSLRRIAKTHSIHYMIGKSEEEEDFNRKFSRFLYNRRPTKLDLDWEMENPFADLTTREMEVLHYWLKGFSTGEIADKLELSKQAISTYKDRIKGKTRAENFRDLGVLATAFGISV